MSFAVRERRFKVFRIGIQKIVDALLSGATIQVVNSELLDAHVHRLEYNMTHDSWMLLVAHHSFDPVPEGEACPITEDLMIHIETNKGFFVG